MAKLSSSTFMTKELRKHCRKEIKVEVKLNYLEDDARTVNTINVSKGGVYLALDNPEHYTMGELVTLQFNDALEDIKDPFKNAVIVRQAGQGIAVAFIEMNDF